MGIIQLSQNLAGEETTMTAESFLDAECVLWTERDDMMDDGNGDVIASRSGVPGMTWRDWLVDFLATAYTMGEGFDAKRPNCSAGWQETLRMSLHAHKTSFTEVLVAAFGMKSDMRPRSIMRPFGTQTASFRTLLEFMAFPETDGSGNEELAGEKSGEEFYAALEILMQAVGWDERLRAGPQASRKLEETSGVPMTVTVTMGTIGHARRYAVAHADSANWMDKEHWSCFIEYLDTLVLRRHPTYSFLGMPLMW